ncbi:hypothetical protein Ahy_B06g081623 [Arachis hypogaea]|uniref:Peptidase A1 domain-containing protein n=1 Tax=Arachis hypogaea TaxID=3818 RepID=A0A444YLG5_ARAHY|nr:hypothetical protein Ahy_B06g081623 [Arachis hypogaea]
MASRSVDGDDATAAVEPSTPARISFLSSSLLPRPYLPYFPIFLSFFFLSRWRKLWGCGLFGERSYTGAPKKRTFKMFSFRGVDLDALLDMSTDEVVKLFTIRARRRFQRGLTHKPMALIKKLRTSCKIPYGHGSIYRFFSQDVVKVGDIVIKDQVIIKQYCMISGVTSLKYDSSKEYNMIDQGYIYQNVFSLWLNKDPMAEIGGEIVFGGINSRHFRGEHTYVPISQKSYWQVNSRFRTSSLILLINHIDVGDVLLANRSTITYLLLSFLRKAIQEEEEEEEKEKPPYANLEEEEGGGGEEEELACANLEEEDIVIVDSGTSSIAGPTV